MERAINCPRKDINFNFVFIYSRSFAPVPVQASLKILSVVHLRMVSDVATVLSGQSLNQGETAESRGKFRVFRKIYFSIFGETSFVKFGVSDSGQI